MGTAIDTSRRTADPQPVRRPSSRGWGVGQWILGVLAFIAIAIYIASFFLDSIVRQRVLAGMNSKLVGYHTTLKHAHVQLLNGSLYLTGLVVHQDKHPTPPVADVRQMAFHIQLREIFTGHVVADVLLTHPHVHINLTQLRAEKADPVPLSQKGWQDAIQAIYPFKINRFRIRDGEFTYIDTDPQRPLHFTDLTFRADNIRNIHYRAEVYPSPFHAESIVFERGRMTIDGKANFLTRPLPSMLALHLDYVHTAQSAPAETERAKAVKQAAAKVTNAPDVLLKVHQVSFIHSELKFMEEAADPHFSLDIADLNLKAENLSNHFSEGPARINLTGKLMGSGNTTMTAILRPSNNGPDLDFDLAAQDVDLTRLNDLLRAYGKFDVAAGQISV